MPRLIPLVDLLMFVFFFGIVLWLGVSMLNDIKWFKNRKKDKKDE